MFDLLEHNDVSFADAWSGALSSQCFHLCCWFELVCVLLELSRVENALFCVSSALAFCISREIMFVLALKLAKEVTLARRQNSERVLS